MRQIGRALVALLALLFMSHDIYAMPPDRQENSFESLIDEEKYLQLLAPASADAARILSALGDPVFSDKAGVALQLLPDRPVSVAVLFPTKRSFPEYLKSIQASAHSFCRIGPAMSPNALRIVLCDPDEIRKLEILIRISHNHEYISKLKNDWAIMQLLERIRVEPAKILKEAKPQVSDEHMEMHMAFILAFLWAHEAWHLTHSLGTDFDGTGDSASTATSELANKFICRNYHEFSRQGVTLGIADDSSPVDEEGTTEDPTTRRFFAETRAIWKVELAADEYGGEIMARLISYMKKIGTEQNEIEQSVSEVIQNFGHITLNTWHTKLQPFAKQHCSNFEGQDFFLTRCMCYDSTIYRQVTNLFGATHPPIVLRMYSAGKKFAEQVREEAGIDISRSQNPELLIAKGWLILLGGMLDVPLKLSFAECAQLQKFTVPGGKIVQILPDLAGFVGPSPNDRYPGYPADEAAFISQCLLGTEGAASQLKDSKKKQSTSKSGSRTRRGHGRGQKGSHLP